MEILTVKPILFLLGLCSGYIPYDEENPYKNLPSCYKENELDISNNVCFNELKSKPRRIKIKNPIDKFEREYFNWQVNKAVGRK